MVNGKAPVYGTVALLGVLLAALIVLQPYTADWPGSDYAEPSRRYMRAALRQDSLELNRLSTSVAPVRWVLAAARRHPDTLALWTRRLQVYIGQRTGDTTEVFVYPRHEACDGEPIVLRFVGSGTTSKVLEASSACLGPG